MLNEKRMKTYEAIKIIGAERVQSCLADETEMAAALQGAFAEQDHQSVQALQTVRQNPIKAGALADQMHDRRAA
jgi:hypothetical protein